MYRFEVRQLVVVAVDAEGEEEARIAASSVESICARAPPVDQLVVAELDKVGLVLLISRRDQTVDLAAYSELDASQLDADSDPSSRSCR